VRTLVLGGIRSGKSRWAESAIAAEAGPGEPVRYLATGAAADADPSWARRLAEHRARRPPHWSTVETVDVARRLREVPAPPTLIDDLGGWLTAALHGRRSRGGAVSADVDELVDAVSEFGSPLVMVSPEVGLAVVPATESGRWFADEIGELNRRLADVSERVVLVIAGQSLTVKDDDR